MKENFFKVHYELLSNEKINDSKLGHTGILLFSLMANQVGLSKRPQNKVKYTDPVSGRIFILFSENRAGEMLGLSKGTYYKYKKKLKQLGLIDYSAQLVKSQGNSTPIYVTEFEEWCKQNGGKN